MATNDKTNHNRRIFLKAGAATAVASLAGCGGGSDEPEKTAENHQKYGFYFGDVGADGLRNLAKFETVALHPNYITATIAKATGIKKPIAYGSLIAAESSTSNTAAIELMAQVVTNQWQLKNKHGFEVRVPGSAGMTSVIDIRIPAAYDAMKKYLTGLVDQGYEGIYLDGLDRAVSFVNRDPQLQGLTEASIKLMYEVSDYTKKRGKMVMSSAAFTTPATGSLNPLTEAIKATDVTVVPQIFSATNDFEEIPQMDVANRSAALAVAALESGKKNVEIVGVEIARNPAEKLCDTLNSYDKLTNNMNIQYSVFFDRPLLDTPPNLVPVFPGDTTHLQPRKLELTRPEIVAANAALVEPSKQQCVMR